MLSIRYISGISPGSLIVLTTISAGLLAYLSWKFIERPTLSLKATFQARHHAPPSFALPEKQMINHID